MNHKFMHKTFHTGMNPSDIPADTNLSDISNDEEIEEEEEDDE